MVGCLKKGHLTREIFLLRFHKWGRREFTTIWRRLPGSSIVGMGHMIKRSSCLLWEGQMWTRRGQVWTIVTKWIIKGASWKVGLDSITQSGSHSSITTTKFLGDKRGSSTIQPILDLPTPAKPSWEPKEIGGYMMWNHLHRILSLRRVSIKGHWLKSEAQRWGDTRTELQKAWRRSWTDIEEWGLNYELSVEKISYIRFQ